jgi:hypothetical protein
VVFGFLLHGRQVSAANIPQFLDSMRIIFDVCAGLCVAGLFCSMGRVQRH